MKRIALLARVTVGSAALAAGLAWTYAPRQAQATPPPGCTQPLFVPPTQSPHFSLPSAGAGAWAEYRGAAIEHDWTDARRRLEGPRPPSFRPLRSLLAWLESLLTPRPHQAAVCLHCRPIGFELGYDELPADGTYFHDPPQPPRVPSPEFNPMPVPSAGLETPESSPPPAANDPAVVVDPPALVQPPVEPPTPAVTPSVKPEHPPVVELAPEVVLPMDPPTPVRPPRNTIPKPAPKPPKNLVPRYK